MAWSTALGTGLDQVWKRLLAGEDGLCAAPSPHRLRNNLVALVADPAAESSPAQRQRGLTSQVISGALADAGLAAGVSGQRSPHPVIGTSFGAYLDEDGDLAAWARDAAAHAGLNQRPIVVSTACSSGADAIAIGADLLRSGRAEVCVCGGADVVTPAKLLAHSMIGTMSPTRLRAFDRRADGTLLGEGAGFLVLETAESALRRGIHPYAVLRGTGAANEGMSMTAPDPGGAGVLLAVRRSLAAGNLGLNDIAVINAHGSGTPTNDAAEAVGFGRLFGGCDEPPTVFATKGAFGHCLGATGAIEAIAVILALRHRRVPPVPGLESVIADLRLPIALGHPSSLGPGAGMSLTLGFGGFTTCLVFEAGDRDVP